MDIKIGVIGCGYWGPNLVRNFSQLRNADVVYVCDLEQSRLDYIKEFYPFLKTTRDYQDVLRDKEIDAVCVATSAAAHFQIARDALLNDKHIFVEKPMTLNATEAKELIRLAEERNKVLMVGHTFEYNEAVNKLKNLIEKGELGKILYIYMTRLNLGIFRDDINVVWDLCPHDISILNYILGKEPISVRADGFAHYKKGVEDVAFVLLRYPQNITANLQVSWLDPCKVRKTIVVGDKKMAIYDDLNDSEPIKICDKGIIKQPYYNTFGDFKLLYNWGDIYSPKINIVEPLNRECLHFLECIEKGVKPRSDGSAGFRVVKAIEAIEKSMRNNGEIVNIN